MSPPGVAYSQCSHTKWFDDVIHGAAMANQGISPLLVSEPARC